MQEKDLRPTRHRLVIRCAQEFVTEFFEQNPISQLGVIGMRDGLAVRVSDMSGNPNDHLGPIEILRVQDPKGHPSLQNALEMARGALFHAPSHGTREVVMVLGALSSSDPGDIHQTIDALVTDKIRVGVVGLAAQVAICREMVVKTNDGVDGEPIPLTSTDARLANRKLIRLRETAAYGVALNEAHVRDLLLDFTNPPIMRSENASRSSLLMMGFPSRVVETHASLCACHSKLTRGGYLCSRCTSKVCSLPADCPACGLTLILSTHLARSYQHLFPLKNWVEVAWPRAERSTSCYACLAPFPPIPTNLVQERRRSAVVVVVANGDANGNANGVEHRDGEAGGVVNIGIDAGRNPDDGAQTGTKNISGTSPSSRYECTVCHQHFCIDCDLWAHEVVHNCPGCQSCPPPVLS